MAAEYKGTKKSVGWSQRSKAAESQQASGKGLTEYITYADSLCRSCHSHMLGMGASGDVVGGERTGRAQACTVPSVRQDLQLTEEY